MHRRGRYSAAFKQEVALEALKGAKTIQQIASDHGISADLVQDWKRQAKEHLAEGFKRKRKTREAELQTRIAHLERLLGKRDFELDWLTKKSRELDLEEDSETAPSRSRQCELLGLQRSGTHYKPRTREGDAAAKTAINEVYAKNPCLGARRMPDVLARRYGIKAGRKRGVRLKREMGLRTVYCHPRTGAPGRGREGRHPYLLGEIGAIGVDEVWTSDITYLQIGSRNYYLCAVMDWSSRCVLGWDLGANMGLPLCMRALDMALGSGRVPKVFNTDQGSQYTSGEWQERMRENGIAVSQDGKGRWADNIVMERFWRTYKHEFFLLREPDGLEDARCATAAWMDYYNTERPHATLGNMAPAEYRKRRGAPPRRFFQRFFRSGTARAAVPPLQNR